MLACGRFIFYPMGRFTLITSWNEFGNEDLIWHLEGDLTAEILLASLTG